MNNKWLVHLLYILSALIRDSKMSKNTNEYALPGVYKTFMSNSYMRFAIQAGNCLSVSSGQLFEFKQSSSKILIHGAFICFRSKTQQVREARIIIQGSEHIKDKYWQEYDDFASCQVQPRISFPENTCVSLTRKKSGSRKPEDNDCVFDISKLEINSIYGLKMCSMNEYIVWKYVPDQGFVQDLTWRLDEPFYLDFLMAEEYLRDECKLALNVRSIPLINAVIPKQMIKLDDYIYEIMSETHINIPHIFVCQEQNRRDYRIISAIQNPSIDNIYQYLTPHPLINYTQSILYHNLIIQWEEDGRMKRAMMDARELVKHGIQFQIIIREAHDSYKLQYSQIGKCDRHVKNKSYLIMSTEDVIKALTHQKVVSKERSMSDILYNIFASKHNS